MWIDLFRSMFTRLSPPSVESAESVEAPSQPLLTLSLPPEPFSHGTLAKSVESVDTPTADTFDTRLHASVSMAAETTPRHLSPRLETLEGDAASLSTQSTPSTPGKHCCLLTPVEKDRLLARFDLQLVLDEMQSSVAGGCTAHELRRTLNLAWWLITVEGSAFETAMAKAAEWVVSEPMHRDEHDFADVLTFSKTKV